MSISHKPARSALLKRMYLRARPQGAGFRRFIAFSLWRALSMPPRGMPLALCEGRSVRDDEGTRNTKGVDVEVIPTGEALFAPIEGEEKHDRGPPFSTTRRSTAGWYFPDMTPEEVLFIKLYDSDHHTAWRCPHTAFRDCDFRADARRTTLDGVPRRGLLLKPLARCASVQLQAGHLPGSGPSPSHASSAVAADAKVARPLCRPLLSG